MILIGGIFFVNTSVFSKTDFNLYTLPASIKDLSFKISSEQLNEVLKSKKILSPEQNVYALAFWYKGKKKIELRGVNKLKREIKVMIKEAFEQKTSFVWGNDFSKWIEGYSEEHPGKDQLLYKDPTGILEKSEISINHSKQRIVINEKKPIGSIRTNVELSYPKWSKSKAVIQKTSRVAYEGSRVVRSSTQITFEKVKDKIYLPTKIAVQSTQSVTFESEASLDRIVNEEFIISDYKINRGIAKDEL